MAAHEQHGGGSHLPGNRGHGLRSKEVCPALCQGLRCDGGQEVLVAGSAVPSPGEELQPHLGGTSDDGPVWVQVGAMEYDVWVCEVRRGPVVAGAPTSGWCTTSPILWMCSCPGTSTRTRAWLHTAQWGMLLARSHTGMQGQCSRRRGGGACAS